MCYTLCQRCCENAVAAGLGKGFEEVGKQVCIWGRASHKYGADFISRQGVYESPRPPFYAPTCGQSVPKCGHTPGKVAGQRETVKAEMNGLTPGLDRSPPPRWMGGQGGQSLKVFGRTRSFWGLSSPKIEMGGKALKWLSRLDYPLAKTGETVNGGAESAVHLDR